MVAGLISLLKTRSRGCSDVCLVVDFEPVIYLEIIIVNL